HRNNDADFHRLLRGDAADIDASCGEGEKPGQHNLAAHLTAHDVSSIARFLEYVIQRPGSAKCKRQNVTAGTEGCLNRHCAEHKGATKESRSVLRTGLFRFARNDNYAAVVARPVLSRLSR